MTREEELEIIIDGIENLDNGILSQSHYIALESWKSILSGLPELLEMPR